MDGHYTLKNVSSTGAAEDISRVLKFSSVLGHLPINEGKSSHFYSMLVISRTRLQDSITTKKMTKNNSSGESEILRFLRKLRLFFNFFI